MGARRAPLPCVEPTVDLGAPRALAGHAGRDVADGRGVDQDVVARALQRLVDLHEESAAILRRLGEIQLADPHGAGLMNCVPVDAPVRLLSVRDVADRVGVQPRTIRRWREAGLLPAGISFGGILRWRPEAIDAWILEQEGRRR